MNLLTFLCVCIVCFTIVGIVEILIEDREKKRNAELKKCNSTKVHIGTSCTDAEWKKIAQKVISHIRHSPREKFIHDTQIMKWGKGK